MKKRENHKGRVRARLALTRVAVTIFAFVALIQGGAILYLDAVGPPDGAPSATATGDVGSMHADIAASAMSPDAVLASVGRGAELFSTKGCKACHSLDGTKIVGPSLAGIVGRDHEMTDGSIVRVDEAYIRQSIEAPDARVRKGYGAMPSFEGSLSRQDIADLVAFLMRRDEMPRT